MSKKYVNTKWFFCFSLFAQPVCALPVSSYSVITTNQLSKHLIFPVVVQRRLISHGYKKCVMRSSSLYKNTLTNFSARIFKNVLTSANRNYYKQNSHNSKIRSPFFAFLGAAAISVSTDENGGKQYSFTWDGNISCDVVVPYFEEFVNIMLLLAKKFPENYDAKQAANSPFYILDLSGKMYIRALQLLLEINPKRSYPPCNCGHYPCRYKKQLARMPDYDQDIKDAITCIGDTLVCPERFSVTTDSFTMRM